MRFSEIYVRCNECYINVYEEIKKINNGIEKNSITELEIHNCLRNILNYCQELRDISGIKNYLQDIENILFDRNLKSEKLLYKLETLRSSIWAIMNLLMANGIEHGNWGLDIKMPPIDNITDFKKYIDDLEFIFTKCPFFKDDKESLKIRGVDIGSIWLVLAISGITVTTGSVLINNIAAFIDKCYVIKSHKLTCEQQKIELEKARIELKQKEDMIKTVDQMYQISVSNAISDLENITKIEIEDNDERDRVIQSFDRLDKLIDKGLQIYASIDSPQEVKAVFAPIEMHYLPQKENVTKIEKKADKQ